MLFSHTVLYSLVCQTLGWVGREESGKSCTSAGFKGIQKLKCDVMKKPFCHVTTYPCA